MEKIKLIYELIRLTKNDIKIQIFSFILVVLNSIMKILLPFFIMKVFDVAITNKDIDKLLFYTSLIIFSTIISAVCEIVYQKIVSTLSRKMVIDLRKKAIEHIKELSGDFYTSYSSGDLFTTLYHDTEEIPRLVTTSLFNFISNIIIVVGLVIFLIKLEKELLIILVLFQIIFFILQNYYNKKIKIATEGVRGAIGNLNGSAQEMLGNILAFVENDLLNYYEEKHSKYEQEYASKNVGLLQVYSINNAVLNLINSVTIAVILGYGGYKVIQGDLTYGAVFTFVLYSQKFMSPLLQIIRFNNEVTSSQISWNRFNELLNTEVTTKTGENILDKNCNVLFDNVSFFYEEGKYILKNVNLELQRGNVYAFVGKSGCGKTTLTHLLFRFWDTTDGKILIDNMPIENYNIDHLRSNISVVSQNIFLLNDTIYNNIVLNNKIQEYEYYDILKKTGLFEFVENLPNKSETIVGENGIRLSGGEKQRISIARALLNRKSILIFDEATSMLDNKTEEKIIETILELFSDTLIILIAHRLSTVKNANCIFVLNDGEVQEKGCHSELINKKGIYYDLYNVSNKEELKIEHRG